MVIFNKVCEAVALGRFSRTGLFRSIGDNLHRKKGPQQKHSELPGVSNLYVTRSQKKSFAAIQANTGLVTSTGGHFR